MVDRDGQEATTWEVGIYEVGGAYDVVWYTDGSAACADFVYREATWVLRGKPRSRQ